MKQFYQVKMQINSTEQRLERSVAVDVRVEDTDQQWLLQLTVFKSPWSVTELIMEEFKALKRHVYRNREAKR